jgi:hypothetical protein
MMSSTVPFEELRADDRLIFTIASGKKLEVRVLVIHIRQGKNDVRSGLVVEPEKITSPDFKTGEPAALRFTASDGQTLKQAKGLSDVADKATIQEDDFGFLTQGDKTGNFLIKSVELRRDSTPST